MTGCDIGLSRIIVKVGINPWRKINGCQMAVKFQISWKGNVSTTEVQQCDLLLDCSGSARRTEEEKE